MSCILVHDINDTCIFKKSTHAHTYLGWDGIETTPSHVLFCPKNKFCHFRDEKILYSPSGRENFVQLYLVLLLLNIHKHYNLYSFYSTRFPFTLNFITI